MRFTFQHEVCVRVCCVLRYEAMITERAVVRSVLSWNYDPTTHESLWYGAMCVIVCCRFSARQLCWHSVKSSGVRVSQCMRKQ